MSRRQSYPPIPEDLLSDLAGIDDEDDTTVSPIGVLSPFEESLVQWMRNRNVSGTTGVISFPESDDQKITERLNRLLSEKMAVMRAAGSISPDDGKTRLYDSVQDDWYVWSLDRMDGDSIHHRLNIWSEYRHFQDCVIAIYAGDQEIWRTRIVSSLNNYEFDIDSDMDVSSGICVIVLSPAGDDE